MNTSSKWSAKGICATLSIIMLIGLCMTGCAAEAAEIAEAPAAPVSYEETAATEAPAAATTEAAATVSPLAQELGVPVPWQVELKSSDGMLTVLGDITVTLPDASAVPVAAVVFRELTERELQNVTTAFFGEGVTFTGTKTDTREYAEEYLRKWKELYDSILDGTCENKEPTYHKAVKEQYAYYTERAKSAPSAANHETIPPAFTEYIDHKGDRYPGFRGVAVKDGTEYLVSASPNGISIGVLSGDSSLGYDGTYLREPVGLSVTREQATATAGLLAEKIDAGLSLSHVMAVAQRGSDGEASTWAWDCIFMREINGVRTVYDSRDVGTDMESNVSLEGGRGNEKLTITVDARGVCRVQWANPLTVSEVTNPDAALLPFSKIESYVADQLREKYDYNIAQTSGNRTDTLYMQCAELGLMRIGKPGSGSYKLEPVWSFFIDFAEHPDYAKLGQEIGAVYRGDPVRWNSLTVSAIDGRLIDRDRGY